MANKRIAMMEENRAKLIAAGRAAFAANGYAGASMDDLTAAAGLTRGALYHNFGDKKGLLAAVVEEIDGAMAAKAQAIGAKKYDPWEGLLAEGAAYIEMALDAEVQRIVLLDGPSVLGDPSQWPSQNACLQATRATLERLMAEGRVKQVDVEAAARLINGAALNAALWVAASTDPDETLPRVIGAFNALASGLLTRSA
ncbi:TetR/AcrR family transcriptional regulator [Devosia sp. Leaf64]|jgi:AcrR family transcriptional regulator|uniref:TetR/AcrR family transcriptional regulator n=1 Tax=Devosia sp. Leaf64 TaxID=1736229 RepID=UPI00071336A9|nr:TetR/AcrR family transcriptional regulator [Devosia sp. Leaf64]KQN69809.1 TetR family transcriptional regulator [Devosia sp. Leaf64]